MAIARTVSLVSLLAVGMVTLAQAQNAKPLFIAADMVTGPGGSGPLCVLRSQFMRNERVAWRIRVQDATGKQLDDKGLKSVVVELSDGQKFSAHFGGHPPDRLPLVDLVVDPRGLSDRNLQLQGGSDCIGRHRAELGACQQQAVPADGDPRHFRDRQVSAR
jgi:hypothetical protein